MLFGWTWYGDDSAEVPPDHLYWTCHWDISYVYAAFGMLTGQLLSGWLGLLATYIGGALLLVLGLQMIVASIRKEDKPFIAPVGAGLVLLRQV